MTLQNKIQFERKLSAVDCVLWTVSVFFFLFGNNCFKTSSRCSTRQIQRQWRAFGTLHDLERVPFRIVNTSFCLLCISDGFTCTRAFNGLCTNCTFPFFSRNYFFLDTSTFFQAHCFVNRFMNTIAKRVSHAFPFQVHFYSGNLYEPRYLRFDTIKFIEIFFYAAL